MSPRTTPFAPPIKSGLPTSSPFFLNNPAFHVTIIGPALSDRRVASCYISQVCHSFISFGNRCPLALKNDELIYLLPQHHGEKSSCKPSLILIDTILASAYI